MSRWREAASTNPVTTALPARATRLATARPQLFQCRDRAEYRGVSSKHTHWCHAGREGSGMEGTAETPP